MADRLCAPTRPANTEATRVVDSMSSMIRRSPTGGSFEVRRVTSSSLRFAWASPAAGDDWPREGASPSTGVNYRQARLGNMSWIRWDHVLFTPQGIDIQSLRMKPNNI